ncbi:hypothetical protein KUCAC02_006461 [Chaenocephalus aceratus]|uniref:Uncharacterized protein n=1 Tax=Chaenocephalus aceratus TaxID=36190 RepID=A0ACB9VRY2_CHAAC|nr:hypothetical protein KUCAC02_034619 [Chaenocephalus aceratus]KAI4802893.1 hypothetical protein KUCAC02_006461 [Chaenocephalus aceratus]
MAKCIITLKRRLLSSGARVYREHVKEARVCVGVCGVRGMVRDRALLCSSCDNAAGPAQSEASSARPSQQNSQANSSRHVANGAGYTGWRPKEAFTLRLTNTTALPVLGGRGGVVTEEDVCFFCCWEAETSWGIRAGSVSWRFMGQMVKGRADPTGGLKPSNSHRT